MSKIALEGNPNLEYQFYLKSLYGSDNTDSRRKLIANLRSAVKDELTPRQLLMVKLYFADGLKIHQIAYELGVNKSTVSRTINRGKAKLKRCLKYGAAGLLAECGNDEE